MRVLLLSLLGSILSFSAAAETPPDPDIGRALFTGERSFENGGPACAACHAVGGQGSALVASFGPDLSKSPAALDPDVLDGVLADQPYKSMKPLYAGHPITERERADLGAWLKSAAGHATSTGGAWFALQGAVVALALFAFVLVTGARRPMPAREQLRSAAGGSR